MKTLIINGSPRKSGGTSVLVNRLKELLDGDISVVDTYYCKISPCVDCRFCWTHSECAIKDDMQQVYQTINDADNIVIASPIYFGELTGSLLQWASRLQYFWVSKTFRKETVLIKKERYGGVILVDGGDGYTDTSLAMAKRLLRNMGAEYKDWVYFLGTDRIEPSLPGEPIMEKLRNLSDILNRKTQ
jgi:multimeric flavodoxin WrbA